MKLAFIGGGNMGEALLAAVIKNSIAARPDIVVSDISEARRLYIQETYGVAATPSNRSATGTADVIVLAIKPQQLPGVMAELGGCLKPAQLVISIIAGARLETLQSGLKHVCLVRAMPNTPAQVSQGMTVWTTTPDVSEAQRRWTGGFFRATGREIYVAEESAIDKATALSGSGPAYFFLFIEALTSAGVDIGLSADIAQALAVQTMLGAGELLAASGKGPAELRRLVTSPGGTTEQAVLAFEKGNFTDLVKAAVRAAYDKARKLGGSQ